MAIDQRSTAMSAAGDRPVFDFENPPPLRPLSDSNRHALRAEWLAARDRGDLNTGRDIIRVAKAHDEAWPDEPKLYNQITGIPVHDEQVAEVAA